MDLKTVADTTNIQAYNDLLVKTTADCCCNCLSRKILDSSALDGTATKVSCCCERSVAVKVF